MQARETLLQLFVGFVMGGVLHPPAMPLKEMEVYWPALVLSNMLPLMWKELGLRVRAVVSVELHDKDKSCDLKNIIIAQEAEQG